jgi:hypothetical protein
MTPAPSIYVHDRVRFVASFFEEFTTSDGYTERIDIPAGTEAYVIAVDGGGRAEPGDGVLVRYGPDAGVVWLPGVDLLARI